MDSPKAPECVGFVRQLYCLYSLPTYRKQKSLVSAPQTSWELQISMTAPSPQSLGGFSFALKQKTQKRKSMIFCEALKNPRILFACIAIYIYIYIYIWARPINWFYSVNDEKISMGALA